MRVPLLRLKSFTCTALLVSFFFQWKTCLCTHCILLIVQRPFFYIKKQTSHLKCLTWDNQREMRQLKWTIHHTSWRLYNYLLNNNKHENKRDWKHLLKRNLLINIANRPKQNRYVPILPLLLLRLLMGFIVFIKGIGLTYGTCVSVCVFVQKIKLRNHYSNKVRHTNIMREI